MMAINTKLGQNTFKDSKAALSGLGQKSGLVVSGTLLTI